MDKFRVFVADKLAAEGVRWLEQQPDVEVDFTPGLDVDAACRHIAEADAIIVRSATKVRGELLSAARRLRAIGRAGIGVDNIDIDAATERGIVVLNTPDANATTTAELAIAHMCSLSRHLPQADRSVRAGEWKRSAFEGTELRGKVFGIIGYGTIGRIAGKLARGLDMQVVAHDPFVTREAFEAQGVEPLELEELLARADYVSLHCPLTEGTRGLINAERLALMKPTARIINCARGGLIDEQALYEALKARRIAGAALDVYAKEPPGESPLFELDNCVFTPHLGASTEEAQVAVGVQIAEAIVRFLRSGEAINAVNLPPVSSEELRRLRPYQQLAAGLGRVLAAMMPGALKSLQVSLHGEAAALDSHPVAIEALVGLLGAHLEGPVNRVNAMHIARAHGIAVEEARTEETAGYVNLVTLTARADDGELALSGTLFDGRHPRLVRVNDYEMEAPLDGYLLFTRHIDQPGVIGALGQVLGEADINISRMNLGVAEGSDRALAVLAVSRCLPDEVLAAIERIPAVDQVTQVCV